jgi:hypothetical protein
MMTRGLYQCLIWLHPPAFKRRFEVEMLWIFDEAADTWGVASLIADASMSLIRQWLTGSGLWKVVAAGVGGTVPLIMGFGSLINWSSVWRVLGFPG